MNEYKRRNVLSLDKRVQVINDYHSHSPKPKFGALAKKYKASSAQIRSILLNQKSILKEYEESGENSGKESPNEILMKTQDKTDSSLYKNRNILCLADRVKVIREYTSQTPSPSFSAMAFKYNVSTSQITNILLNQESILQLYQETRENNNSDNDDAHDVVLKDRLDKIEFLGRVMYEYVQRALYHKVTIDDDMVLQKTEEVKECIAVKNFRTTILWLIDFKKSYGIDNFSLESLRTRIALTEMKHRQLDAVDMVRYVCQQEKKGLSCHSQKADCSGSIKDINHSIGEPKIVYEKFDDEILKNSVTTKGQLSNSSHFDNEDSISSGDEAVVTIKIETSSTQLGEDIVSNLLFENVRTETLSNVLLEQNVRHYSPLTGTEDNGVTVERAIIKTEMSPTRTVGGLERVLDEAFTDLPTNQNQRCDDGDVDHLQNNDVNVSTVNEPYIKTEMSPSSLSDDEEFMKIYKIIDDDVIVSPKTNEKRSPKSSLVDFENNLQLTDSEILVNVKQEPVMGDDEIEPRSSTGIISDETNTHQVSKPLSLQTPTGGVNSEAVIEKTSQLSEDIQSQIILERFNDSVVMVPCRCDQLSTFRIIKGQSPLHGIDSLEEAMQYLKLLEDYATLKDNDRAINLLMMLGKAFKEPHK